MKSSSVNQFTSEVGIEIAEWVISINFHPFIYFNETAESETCNLFINSDNLENKEESGVDNKELEFCRFWFENS